MLKCVILSGIPGSGKSHLAERLKGDVASADHFVPDDPKPYEIAEAHKKCYARFQGLLLERRELVIVDNTNLTAWEINPYYLGAEAAKYEVVIQRVHCDAEVAWARKVHKVPFLTFCIMVANFAKRDVKPWWNVQD